MRRHWFEPNGAEIADLLTGLTDARKAWGFGLCFVHLRNVKGTFGTTNASIRWPVGD